MMVTITEVTQGNDDADTANADELVEDIDGQDTVEGAEGSDASSLAEQPETLVVTIGDAAPEDGADIPIKQWRENHKELAKQLREANRKLAAIEGVNQPPALGAKPTLDGANYDTEKYEKELEAWHAKKFEVDAANKQRAEQEQKAGAAWQAKLDGYGKAKDTFKTRAPDFDDAEAEVQNALSQTQQGIVVKGAKDAPLLVYALHKNPAKLKELAAISDPVEFTWQIAQLEAQLKVSTSTARQVEERVEGVRHAGNTNDLHLAKLEKEADRTGDRTAIARYKKQVAEKQRQKAAA